MDIGNENRIEITPPFSNLDPHNPAYGQQEHNMLNHDGDISTTRQREQISDVKTQDASVMFEEVCQSNTLVQYLEEAMFVVAISGVASSTKQGPISLVGLMNRWGMSKLTAKATLLATTQRLIRSLAEPSLNKRSNTNDKMIRYYRIK